MKTASASWLLVSLLGASAAGQIPCPVTGTPVASYFACPIAQGFTSILGQPGTVVLASFGACADNVGTPAGSAVPIPFAFNFFGTAVSFAAVSSNGFLTLGTTNLAGSTISANTGLPNISAPNGFVAPFWDDLKTGPAADASTIAYLPGPTSLVVEWNNMKACADAAAGGAPGTGGSLTFQAVLLSTGEIEFRYGPFTAPSTVSCSPYPADSCGGLASLPQSGHTATIGLESASATVGVDGTGFGGANTRFPLHNVRFGPTSMNPVLPSYTASAAGIGFTTIEGLPGTVTFPPTADLVGNATCPACLDDGNSARRPSGAPGSAAAGATPLPWRVTLFATPARNFNMNSDGVVVLGDPLCNDIGNNADPGTTAHPNQFVTPWWDDLEAKATSFAGWRVDGLPGGRTMTFEWSDFGRHLTTNGNCVATADSVSFQTVFHEGTDAVEFRYDQAGFVSTGFSATTATIEDVDGGAFFAPFLGSLNTTVPFTNLLATPCNCGTVRYYGAGCAGTGGFVPRIGTTGVPPMIGSATFGITLTEALGGALSVLAIAGAPAPPGGLPLIASCPLYVGLAGLNTFVPAPNTAGPAGSGTRCLLLPIPAQPGLACGEAYAQWAIVDGGSASGLVALSDAVKVTLTL